MKQIGDIGMADVIVRSVEALNPITDEDYLGSDKLVYCGKCHTKKQTRVLLTMYSPPQEKVFPVPCKCRTDEIEREKELMEKQREMNKLTKLKAGSLMDEKFRESTFQSFLQTKNNARNLKLCRRYAEGFNEMLEKNQGLLLWGGYGTGKTYAAACIANCLLDRMVPVVMTSFVKILQNVQGFKSDDDEQRFIDLMNRAQLLIVDDLGTERNTDFALEKVYNIVDSRYRARKPMILTTNLTLSQMQEVSDVRYGRIYDRIFEMCYPIEFKGPSWRKKEASARFDEMTKFLEGE